MNDVEGRFDFWQCEKENDVKIAEIPVAQASAKTGEGEVR